MFECGTACSSFLVGQSFVILSDLAFPSFPSKNSACKHFKTKKLFTHLKQFYFAVLSDLDDLKTQEKTKEGARDAIKWLEAEFKKGNRFMRTQRDSENLLLPLLKIPNKLGEFWIR